MVIARRTAPPRRAACKPRCLSLRRARPGPLLARLIIWSARSGISLWGALMGWATESGALVPLSQSDLMDTWLEVDQNAVLRRARGLAFWARRAFC